MSASDENWELVRFALTGSTLNSQSPLIRRRPLLENAPGCSPGESVSCHLLGDVPDDRQLEFFVLVRLDHADDNQHKNA